MLRNSFKFALFCSLIAVPTVNIQSLQADNRSFFPKNSSFMPIGTIIAGGFIAMAGYKLAELIYTQVKDYLENRLLDTVADDIVIAITPGFTLNKKNKEEILRKKARITNMRKRVLIKVQAIVAEANLSNKHKKALRSDIEMKKFFFRMIDAVGTENPYEKEYTNPSMVDTAIENSIVSSMLLNTKPAAECSLLELEEKNAKQKFRKKLMKKLKGRLNAAVYRAFLISGAAIMHIFK